MIKKKIKYKTKVNFWSA